MTRFDVRRSIFDSAGYRPIEESPDNEGQSTSDSLPILQPQVSHDDSLSGNRDLSSGTDWLNSAGLFFSSGGFTSLGGGFAGNFGGGLTLTSSGFGSGGSTDGGPQAMGGGGGGGGGGTDPTVTSTNKKVVEDEVLLGTQVLKATDPDGVITDFRFRDAVGAGWFELAGTKLTEGVWHTITAAERSQLIYHAAVGLTNTNFRVDDRVWVKAKDDDNNWSLTKRVRIRTLHNANSPIVYTTDRLVSSPNSIAMSSVFSVRDEDNNTIKKYRFRDATSASDSGVLTFKGTVIDAGKWLTVNADQLQFVRFQSSDVSAEDTIRIGAFDGKTWGYKSVVLSSIGRPDVSTTGGVILDQLERRSLDTLVRQIDSGPATTIYQIFDTNGNPLSAKLMDGLNRLADGQVHTLTAAQLNDIDVQGGTYDGRWVDDFYVRANNGRQWSEWEKLSIRTEPHYIEAMQRPGWDIYLSQSTNPLVITYSFLQKTPDYYGNDTETNNFIELSASMREGARRALDYWSRVANIQFVEVPDPVGGVIRFGTANLPDDVGAWAYLPGPSSPINEGRPGDVWLNNDYWLSHLDQREGRWGFFTMLHELGHALGLAHPFDNSTLPVLPPATDNEGFTVMSYTGAPAFINDIGVQEKYASSPMLYDIAVQHSTYGPTPVNNPGNDVYMYDNGRDDAVLKTIYDTGGIDEINASNQGVPTEPGFDARVSIDLAPGGFSSIGVFQRATIIFGALVDVTTRARNNIGISFTSWIENAVGSKFDDTLMGNDIVNQLRGGNGNDLLNGRGGNDLLMGEAGNDRYQVRVAEGSDTIADSGSGTDVLELHSHVAGPLGLDDFTEDLTFSKVGNDLVIHFSLNGGADPQGMVTIKGGSANRIETLKLMDYQGNQFGSNINLVSIRNSATFTPTQYALTSTNSPFGFIANPV